MKLIFKLLLPVVMVGAIVLLIANLNGCWGKGDGDGNSTQQETATTSEVKVLRISVVGSDYFYDNNKETLDKVIELIKGVEGEKSIEITDEGASQNAYNALVTRLKAESIVFYEKSN